MSQTIVKVPYAPQTLVDGKVSGGKDLSFEIDVPADAVPNGKGSISVGSGGGVNFNARVWLANSPTAQEGKYMSLDSAGTWQFQIATNPPTPHTPDPTVAPVYQVGPGEKMYLNITVAHDGKTGSDEVRTARCECRAAQ
jgi:hypothetical protein